MKTIQSEQQNVFSSNSLARDIYVKNNIYIYRCRRWLAEYDEQLGYCNNFDTKRIQKDKLMMSTHTFHVWRIFSEQAPRTPRCGWAPGRFLMQLPNYGCRVSHCASRSLSYLFYRCVKRCANAIIDQRSLGAPKNNGLDHVNVEPVMANTISGKRRHRRLQTSWVGRGPKTLGGEFLKEARR